MANNIKEVVLAAIVDSKVQKQLAADPEGYLKKNGCHPTTGQLNGLKALKPQDWDKITVNELGARFANMSGRPVADCESIPIEAER
jgi:hypothetical protein